MQISWKKEVNALNIDTHHFNGIILSYIYWKVDSLLIEMLIQKY